VTKERQSQPEPRNVGFANLGYMPREASRLPGVSPVFGRGPRSNPMLPVPRERGLRFRGLFRRAFFVRVNAGMEF